MRRTMKLAVTSGVVLGAVVTGCGVSSQSGSGHPLTHASSSPAAAAAATAVPAPAPSPDGKYSGSCDVSLSDSLYGQNYLTADVDLQNTGNIGTVIKATVKWGQQGFSPIVASKTVRLHVGQSKTVHFHSPASEEQISRFQDVQLADSNGDGCHYRGSMIRTFGQAQS